MNKTKINNTKRLALEAILFMIADCKDEIQATPASSIEERKALAEQVEKLAIAWERIKKS